MFQQVIRCGAIGVMAWTALVSGEDSLKKLTKAEAVKAAVSKVNPDYPDVARQLKMQGMVQLEAVISEDGSVAEVRIVSGNPVLTKAASQAVKKWKFAPVTEDGKAVKAVAPVELSFKL
jgi:TonB family protein